MGAVLGKFDCLNMQICSVRSINTFDFLSAGFDDKLQSCDQNKRPPLLVANMNVVLTDSLGVWLSGPMIL